MNYFIVNQKDRMIWADVEPPNANNYPPKTPHDMEWGFVNQMYHEAMSAYNSRPHYPYSDKLNWREGQRVELNVHFILQETSDKVRCTCPCHHNRSMVHIAACCHNGLKEINKRTIAIPLPSKDSIYNVPQTNHPPSKDKEDIEIFKNLVYMPTKELIERLGYVDHVLSDEGYQSESEVRKTMALVINHFQSQPKDKEEKTDDIMTVYVPCDENDEMAVGSFTSLDGQSLCYVREMKLKI